MNSKYTYEAEDSRERLETYEWDHVWWEHAKTTGVPRVLYIGDSISCGTRRIATEVAEQTIFFDGYGTSKAVDNPFFCESLRMMARQQGERAVILFNNGLHGFHLDDLTDYRYWYEEMIRFLQKEFEGTPLVLLLSTHVIKEARDSRVVIRNGVVKELAEKYGLPTVDLYTLTKEHEDLLSGDGVHFTKEGYQLIATTLVETVRGILDISTKIKES